MRSSGANGKVPGTTLRGEPLKAVRALQWESRNSAKIAASPWHC